MNLDISRVRHLLKAFDFKTLFIEELGWNHYNIRIEVALEGISFILAGVAEKHGMVVFTCSPLPSGHITNYSARRKIEKQAAKAVHEHIIL